MNRLPLAKQTKIIRLLTEGMSLRAISRTEEVTVKTITKLLKSAGRACQRFHEDTVIGIKSDFIQIDELFAFVYWKDRPNREIKPDKGSIWTYLAMDAQSKMILSYYSGPRNNHSTNVFIHDLAGRIDGKVQITSDGYKPYIESINKNFPTDSDVDYAQLVKLYGKQYGKMITDDNEGKQKGNHRYVGARKDIYFGEPNPKFITTAHAERQNLTLRMHNRRFTRKTNAFSKKYENHCLSLALHFVFYNFCRVHQTLGVTPAIQAGLTKRIMKLEDIVYMANYFEDKAMT